MKKVILLSLFISHASCLLYAQEEGKKSEFGIKFTGFIKSDFWYDSRQVLGSRDELFLFYPKNSINDAQGKDINARGNFNFSAMTSRLSGIIKGPDAFKAKTSGLIETDFSGVSNTDINGLRLRHAWLKLQWKKSSLLIGQWWHPLFGTEVVPTVISLNTGSPFQPFIRNPQATFTYKTGMMTGLISLISQRDNSSDGPKGYSPDYMRNAVMPNVHLQIYRSCEKRVAGIAADYKILRPKLITDSLIKATETIASWAAMGYFRYKSGLWEAKAKAIYGQNLTEHLLMGGYAEKSIDSTNGIITYTPLNHLMSWGNILYGKKVQIGLFGGYAHNFGSRDFIQGKIYGRGPDVAYVWRLAPSLSFTSGKTQFSTELEYTVAAYGTPNMHGRVINAKEVANTRLLFTAFYYF